MKRPFLEFNTRVLLASSIALIVLKPMGSVTTAPTNGLTSARVLQKLVESQTRQSDLLSQSTTTAMPPSNTHPQLALKVCVGPRLSAGPPCDRKPTALREAVARLYNTTYRKSPEKASSQYTYENVCIVPGGRAGLSRIAAVTGDVYCVRFISDTHPFPMSSLTFTQSYQVPDYTAYDQMLSAFKRLVPVPTA
jgi:hypothetical protein